MTSRPVRALAGMLCGLLAGLVLTLGVVVARARLEGVYLHAFPDLIGWVSLPFVVFPLLGAWISWSTRVRLVPVAGAGVTGLIVGAVVGAAAGGVLSDDPAWLWAGGVLGAATGVMAGFVGRLIRDLRAHAGERSAPGGDGRVPAVAAVALLATVAGVATYGQAEAGPLPSVDFEEPDPTAVESVVYLVGDPGVTGDVSHPTLRAVEEDVERWSEAMEGRERVAVLVLGDIVYPDGLGEPGSAQYAGDTAQVADQVRMVAGPEARRHGARGFFVAGNHDWGQEDEWKGAVRLHRLADYLGGWDGVGVDVALEPAPGTGGPAVVDVGERLRLILLDTAWWLYDSDPLTRTDMIRGVAEALHTAGDRRTVVAAHHPLRSGGPHGDLRALGSTLGLRALLARSGAMLQDLHSEPYRELLQRLARTFEEYGAPDVFAGGHEHSLQVIRGDLPTDPGLNVVSGSAAKLTAVEPVEGTEAALSAPGYVKLFALRDGGLRVSVEAAPSRYLECGGDAVDTCMRAGVDAFRTVWAGEP